MNQQGQGEDVFRLLIGAVMGLAIMVIIISVINYFAALQQSVSEERLYDGFKIALENVTKQESPDMKIEKGVRLPESTYTSQGFAAIANFNEECIEFQGTKSFELIGDSTKEFGGADAIHVKKFMELDIYYKCFSYAVNTNCPIYCIVSFGKQVTMG